jgi:hypothetical protein
VPWLPEKVTASKVALASSQYGTMNSAPP